MRDGSSQASRSLANRRPASAKMSAIERGDLCAERWLGAERTRLPDGTPDRVKRTDFLYRAAPDVTVAGKAFAEAYCGAKVGHAYFDGCSTGGRMAMREVDRYPQDDQGVIAGDPLTSNITSAARAVVRKAALSSAASYIPEAALAAIDARVTGQCDAIDGAKDGLVQNPSACPVHAENLLRRPDETGGLPECGSGAGTEESYLALSRYPWTCRVRAVGDHRLLGGLGVLRSTQPSLQRRICPI